MAHTAANVYETKLRLYELEELLLASFMKISKSSIFNTDYSIEKAVTTEKV